MTHARPQRFVRRLLPSKRLCGRIALGFAAFVVVFFAGVLGGWATFSV
jgi:hypothetical protein